MRPATETFRVGALSAKANDCPITRGERATNMASPSWWAKEAPPAASPRPRHGAHTLTGRSRATFHLRHPAVATTGALVTPRRVHPVLYPPTLSACPQAPSAAPEAPHGKWIPVPTMPNPRRARFPLVWPRPHPPHSPALPYAGTRGQHQRHEPAMSHSALHRVMVLYLVKVTEGPC